LVEVLRECTDVIGKPLAECDGKPQRKKALVPGCGRGVDVCLLESFGYDCVGLEYSAKAVEACEKYAQENEGTYLVQDENIGKGSKVFVQGDFYKDDWLEKTGLGVKHFDLIYDYTVGTGAPATNPAADSGLVLLRYESSHATGLGNAYVAIAGPFSTRQPRVPRIPNHQGSSSWRAAFQLSTDGIHGALKSSWRESPL
jgi:hypothetical protein